MRFVVVFFLLWGCREEETPSSSSPNRVGVAERKALPGPVSRAAPIVDSETLAVGSTAPVVSVSRVDGFSVGPVGSTGIATSSPASSVVVERLQRIVMYKINDLARTIVTSARYGRDFFIRRWNNEIRGLQGRVMVRAAGLRIPSDMFPSGVRAAGVSNWMSLLDWFELRVLDDIGDNWIDKRSELNGSQADVDVAATRLHGWPIEIVQDSLRFIKYVHEVTVDGILRHTVDPDLETSVARYTEAMKQVHQDLVKAMIPGGYGYEGQFIRALNLGFSRKWRITGTSQAAPVTQTHDQFTVCFEEVKREMESIRRRIDAEIASGGSTDLEALRSSVTTHPISSNCNEYLHASMREAYLQLVSYAQREVLKKSDLDWYNT